MEYGKITAGTFRVRPNRFIAHVEIDGKLTVCHVKNTGRCRELLTDGATVYLEESSNPCRKTKYDLVAVEKGGLLINMDSQAPNRAAGEYLPQLIPGITFLRSETTFGDSRFDFYAEAGEEKWFIEVKGVTLEDKGAALFPDAPTLRGIKHINELCRCMEEGYKACLLFVVQMKGVSHFSPNTKTHPEFTAALKKAWKLGVRIEAVDCIVTPSSMLLDKPVKIIL